MSFEKTTRSKMAGKKHFDISMDIPGCHYLNRQRDLIYWFRVNALWFYTFIMVLSLSAPAIYRNYQHNHSERPVPSRRSHDFKPAIDLQDVKEDVENVSIPLKVTKPDQVFDPIILDAASRHNLDPALIKAIIMAESGFKPKAVSKRGAKGLMQLMPRTATSLGVRDAFDPEHNIHGGSRYFKYLLGRFNGDIKLGLAAYNAGSSNVRKYNGIPPYRATRIYIKKVLKYYKVYKKEFNEEKGIV